MFRVIVITILFVTIIIGLMVAIAALRGGLAGFFGRMQAEVDIESANSRIANYNMFFNRCASIQGYEDQLVVLEEQLASTPQDDTEERNRLRQTIAGLKGQRARAINRYNADSSRDYTAARFRDSDLPYQLSVERSNTECAVR